MKLLNSNSIIVPDQFRTINDHVGYSIWYQVVEQIRDEVMTKSWVQAQVHVWGRLYDQC